MNWLRKAQVEESKPYYIERVGGNQPTKRFSDNVWATSVEQAWAKTFEMKPHIAEQMNDHRQLGFDFQMIVDFETLNSYKRREKSKKKEEAEFLQNAWWNQ